jgi:hypothetical protein
LFCANKGGLLVAGLSRIHANPSSPPIFELLGTCFVQIQGILVVLLEGSLGRVSHRSTIPFGTHPVQRI